MIIKRLRMENIRSYTQADVEFPGGKTLFEGDIGSGKSTILMAVEFALFGLGSARASSLLRFGEQKGSVELDFEVGGKDYSVRRVLAKKAGSVQQVEGRLRGPEGEEDYPASELKERILAVLGFREPTDPRSRSLIYQYAIYSPQEEMKLILALPSRDRVQILRRAFGVEEYKVAMENAKELLHKVHEKKSQFEFASRDVPVLRKEMREFEDKARRGEEELDRLTRSEREQDSSLRELRAKKEGLHEVEVQLGSALRDKDNLAGKIASQRGDAEDTEADMDRLALRRDRLSSGFERAGEPPSEKTVPELKATISAIRSDIEKHKASDVEMGTKIRQFESVAEDGKCPVCERPASVKEFEEKVSGLSGEMERNSVHLERLKGELEELEKLLEMRRTYDALVVKAKDDQARIKEYQDDWEKKAKSLDAKRVIHERSEKERVELLGRIEVLEEEAKELGPLNRKIESAQKELEATKGRMAELRSETKRWREGTENRMESIARKEKLGVKAMELGEREIWLEEYFIPTTESIEKHVMASINHEFGQSFQRWFGVLVEDSGKEARIDEDFTPLIDQEGYEQDVEFLSGGERTSVALAYRLALSQMVQRFSEGGPSSLILDEPTDGFSKEQLGKVREILDEMANPQVIIVSHERELESMADQIYRVAKVDGESKITR